MKQIDHPINLDRAIGAADNASKGEEKMRNPSTKMPWYLRFARTMKLKGIAATTGIGTLYGLLFASLLLAPLPRMESQPYGGTGTTSSSTDCSPPPSLSFPWLDDHMDASTKEDLFCDIWNGEAVTIGIGIEFPTDSEFGVGYYVFEVASWDDLVNAGSKLNDLKNAFARFEEKAKRKKAIRDACDYTCLVGYEAAALACLKLTALPAIATCEGLAAAALVTCMYNCKVHWEDAIGDIRDDLEDRVIALTN